MSVNRMWNCKWNGINGINVVKYIFCTIEYCSKRLIKQYSYNYISNYDHSERTDLRQTNDRRQKSLCALRSLCHQNIDSKEKRIQFNTSSPQAKLTLYYRVKRVKILILWTLPVSNFKIIIIYSQKTTL